MKARCALRWGAITLASLLGVYLAANLGLAFIYTFFLTHPLCNHASRPIADLPDPQVIWLTSADGRSLQAWYYPGSNGAAILASGGMGGALGDSLPPVRFLIEAGFGVLQIDSRACAIPPAPVTLGGKEVEDIAAGLKFLLQQPEVKRVGAFGFSMGGAGAIRAAARQPEIAAVVAEGGYHNLGKDFTEPEARESLPRKIFLYTIALAYWGQTGVNPWLLSPVDDLAKISPRPVLLIYGEHELESGRGLLQYNAAREPKTLWVVPGGSHGRNHLAAPGEYQQRVADFFALHLLEGEQSAPAP